MEFDFTNDEINTIDNAINYVLNIYECVTEKIKELRIEHESIERIFKIYALSKTSDISIADIYATLCYINVYIYIEVKNMKKNLKPSEIERNKAKKLKKKILNKLNNNLSSGFIYFDYDKYSIKEIIKMREDIIPQVLGDKYETVYCNSHIQKNYRNEHCKINTIYTNNDEALLYPQYGGFIIHQKQLNCS